MNVDNFSDLNEMHKDVLLEIGNIGTGNALTSLSQLTGRMCVLCEQNLQRKLKIIRQWRITALADIRQ